MKMQLGKWGRSLAVRLPKRLTEKYSLKEGDEIDVEALEHVLRASSEARRQTALNYIQSRRFELPPGYKFDREEANAR